MSAHGRQFEAAAMKIAITGATGFVGGRLLDAAIAAGHHVRALTRRSMRARVGVDWVEGALDNDDSLAMLVDGTDAIIHVAGVLKGRTQADFDGPNVGGTQSLIDAARAGGVHRLVHVSSLAAREPKLSLYGGSKARSEQVVAASGVSHAIVRPPAVYGPGDKETLDLFRMARAGIVMLPPRGRLSLIHVDDLARLLLALAEPSAPDALPVEPDDGRDGGWSHRVFAKALGEAVGRRLLTVPMSSPLLNGFARIDEMVRGERAKLTRDRAAYFCHPDWVADPARAAPKDLWQPEIATAEGLASTYRWYRDND
jgi:nucleoside-diphosphate-sugar epimerase